MEFHRPITRINRWRLTMKFAVTRLAGFALVFAVCLDLWCQLENRVQPEIAHNTWTSGTAMPTARMGAGYGVVGTKIYVAGGINSAGKYVSETDIYDAKTNTWVTTGAPIPTPTWVGASAVVNGILYMFGGATATALTTTIVQAYNPAMNKWSTPTMMPAPARNSVTAVAVGAHIYLIGGYDGSRIATVQRYTPATNSWKTEASLLIGKSETQLGAYKTSIIAAGGLENNSVYTNENEGYTTTTNMWKPLHAGLVGQGGCTATINGVLYVAGGNNGGTALDALQAYNITTATWSSLANMPQPVTLAAGGAVGGKLYCIGGASGPSPGNTTFPNVQIYQP
jgi:N-acetylneuraminic acid mutarotase